MQARICSCHISHVLSHRAQWEAIHVSDVRRAVGPRSSRQVDRYPMRRDYAKLLLLRHLALVLGRHSGTSGWLCARRGCASTVVNFEAHRC